jgi:hypothetical protein
MRGMITSLSTYHRMLVSSANATTGAASRYRLTPDASTAVSSFCRRMRASVIRQAKSVMTPESCAK